MHLRNLIHQGSLPAEYGSRHLHLQKKTLLLHYQIPRTGPHAASGRMIGYGLENQSRRRNGARLSATILILTGIGSSKALCNVRSAASTMRARICLRDSVRSAHCLSTRRWTLNGYMAVIRATPLTPPRENKSSGGFALSRGDLEGSMRSRQMPACRTPRNSPPGLRSG
jgi:hypothetical protein